MRAEPKVACCRLGKGMPAAWGSGTVSSVFVAVSTLGVPQTRITSRAASPTSPARIDHAGTTSAAAEAVERQAAAISARPAASCTRPLASHARSHRPTATGGQSHQRVLPRNSPPVAARTGVPNVASSVRACGPCGKALMIATPPPSSAAGTATQIQLRPRARACRAGAATVAAWAAQSTAYDGTRESVSPLPRRRPGDPAPRAGSGCPRASHTSTTSPATPR